MPLPALRSRRRVVAAVVLAALLGAGAFVHHRAHRGPRPRRDFDREVWIRNGRGQEDESGYPIRYRMIPDLRRRHPLEGLRREAAFDLLGPPEYELATGDHPFAEWELGTVRTDFYPGAFVPTLQLEFGPDGRVVRVLNDGW